MPEQRNTARKRSYRVAYATAEPGDGALLCMVRDLSSRGARLDMASTESWPDRFDLHIAGRPRVLRAEVSWRTATELGVRLTPCGAPARDHRPASEGPPAAP